MAKIISLLNQNVIAHDVRGCVIRGKVINVSNDGKLAFIRQELFAPKPTYYVALVARCQLQPEVSPDAHIQHPSR